MLPRKLPHNFKRSATEVAPTTAREFLLASFRRRQESHFGDVTGCLMKVE
jgi:hypothetical protein